MVLAGHHHSLVTQVLHGVIGTVMAELHLLGPGPAGQRQNLMPKTNTEQRNRSIHHLTREGDRILAGLGIPRPIRKEDPVWGARHDLINRRLRGHHRHLAAEIDKNAQDVALNTKVQGDHRVSRRAPVRCVARCSGQLPGALCPLIGLRRGDNLGKIHTL